MVTRALARRCGACLALAALMLQLALSFAHVHKHDLTFSTFNRADGASVRHAPPTRQAAERLRARLADDDDRCPICFSSFLLSSSSVPEAGLKPLPLEFAELDRALDPVSDRLFRPCRAAFQSRAPPIA